MVLILALICKGCQNESFRNSFPREWLSRCLDGYSFLTQSNTPDPDAVEPKTLSILLRSRKDWRPSLKHGPYIESRTKNISGDSQIVFYLFDFDNISTQIGLEAASLTLNRKPLEHKNQRLKSKNPKEPVKVWKIFVQRTQKFRGLHCLRIDWRGAWRADGRSTCKWMDEPNDRQCECWVMLCTLLVLVKFGYFLWNLKTFKRQKTCKKGKSKRWKKGKKNEHIDQAPTAHMYARVLLFFRWGGGASFRLSKKNLVGLRKQKKQVKTAHWQPNDKLFTRSCSIGILMATT